MFVWIVDPYELRSSRTTVRLADHPYPETIVPRLISVAARDGADIVVLGGSTSMGYTPAMLREAFPGTKRPVNLSYSCANVDDFSLIFPLLEQSPSIRRVIISLEFTLIKSCESIGTLFNKEYYTRPWNYTAPEFDIETIELSWRVLLTGLLDMPAWPPPLPDRVEGINFRSPMTATPEDMAPIKRAAEMSRAWVTKAPATSCDAIPSLRTVILPFVRRMAKRGVSVDILSPPYSLALYSDWSVNKDVFSGKGAVFANLMALRRCTIEMISGIENVRFHTFDADLAVTGDLSNYYNSAHIGKYEIYKYIANRIAEGNAVLTAERWPVFETTLKEAVEKFMP
jgi:hypothetical protein